MATSTEPTFASTTATVHAEPPRWHSGSAFFWGIVLILAGGLLAWLLIGYFGTGNFDDLEVKRVKARLEILDKRKAEDAKLLNDSASYLDKGKGKVRVPIERAMELALVDLKKNPPHAAYPLSKSPPAPAALPTPGGAKPGGSAAPGVAPAVGVPAPSPAGAAAPAPSPAGSAAPAPVNPGAGAPAASPAASAAPSPVPSASASPVPSPTDSAPVPANPFPAGSPS